MNDNWWTMQKMIEGRERELRMRLDQIKPWLSQRVERKGGAKCGGGIRGPRPIRAAIGRVLLAWGSALSAK